MSGDLIGNDGSDFVNNDENSKHVVTGSGVDGTAVLDGFIIIGGNATGGNGSLADMFGGGMYSSTGSPSLTNVTFSGNIAIDGGGMGNSDSSPTLTNVTFSGNKAIQHGGGMFNYLLSRPTLDTVTLAGNFADFGGGMFNAGGSPTLTNVIFSNNTSAELGGGMYNNGGTPMLTNVSFSGNTATNYGGGMVNDVYSSPILRDVTFSGNTASNWGGGMVNDEYSSPTLTNVTFYDNTAAELGGGMANKNNSNPLLFNVTFSKNSARYGGGMANIAFTNGTEIFGCNPLITNTIFWGNTPDQIFDDYDSSASITHSIIQGGYAGTTNLEVNPLLGSLADNGGFTQTIALGDKSPAIDAGDLDNCPTSDQRGLSRPIDGNGDGVPGCDIGAYEYNPMKQIFLPLIVR